MKNNMIKRLSLAVAILIGWHMTFATAIDPTPSLRSEVRQYYREHIQPVMKEKREKLDAQLSEAEKQELDQYRAQLKDLREQLRESSVKTGRRQHHKSNELTDEQKAMLQENREARKQIMEKVGTIYDQHKESIDQLLGEIQGDQEQWKTDLQSIAAKYKEDNHDAKELKKRPFTGKRAGLKPLSPTQFLLMDENAFDRPEKTGMKHTKKSESGLYPNPVLEEGVLHYKTKQEGNVQIKLVDDQGNEVSTLANKTIPAGSYEQKLDTSSLEAGIYYVKINTPEGQETIRFVKK